MARLESISTVVEQERLLALVDTQRQHIAELRTQLNEALVSICDITSAPLFVSQPTLQQPRTVTAVRGPTAACHERHCPGVTTVHDRMCDYRRHRSSSSFSWCSSRQHAGVCASFLSRQQLTMQLWPIALKS
jgi:hypothetical protein